MKIKKGDSVKILSGKDKGTTGEVQRVLPKKEEIVVKGVHIVKKHMKSQGKGKAGGIVSKEAPIAASRAIIVCPKCQKPSRVGYQVTGDKKYRRCTRCKEVFS